MNLFAWLRSRHARPPLETEEGVRNRLRHQMQENRLRLERLRVEVDLLLRRHDRHDRRHDDEPHDADS